MIKQSDRKGEIESKEIQKKKKTAPMMEIEGNASNGKMDTPGTWDILNMNQQPVSE